MKVIRIVRNQDGLIEATLMLTPEQATFFMSMGLGMLVQRGAATVVDMTEEEFKAAQKAGEVQGEVIEATTVPTEPVLSKAEQEAIDKDRKQFLEDVPIEALHKA